MDSSQNFLYRLLETIWFSDNWKELKIKLSRHFRAQNESILFVNSDIDGGKNLFELEKQVLLHVCGEEIRKYWTLQSGFTPELLVEPYVLKRDFERMTGKCLSDLFKEVAVFLQEIEQEEREVFSHRSDADNKRTNEEEELILSSFRSDVVCSYDQILRLQHPVLHQSHRLMSVTVPETKTSSREELQSLTIAADTLSKSLAKCSSVHDFVQFCTKKFLIPVVFDEVGNLLNQSNQSLLSKQLTAAECVTAQDFSSSEGLRRMHTLDESGGMFDMNIFMNSYVKQDMDYLCIKMLGNVLPPVFRRWMWTYRGLYRGGISTHKSERIQRSVLGDNANAMCVAELVRYGTLKGHHDIADRCPHSELISRTVALYVEKSKFGRIQNDKIVVKQTPAQVVAPNEQIKKRGALRLREVVANEQVVIKPEHVDRGILLAKRSEHLVFSSYLVTGTLSPRTVNMAILLMQIFPTDSPVSEKILRIYKRLLNEILPSEQLHRDFSLSSVALQTWNLLYKEDRALYHHFQKFALSTHIYNDAVYSSGNSTATSREEQSEYTEDYFTSPTRKFSKSSGSFSTQTSESFTTQSSVLLSSVASSLVEEDSHRSASLHILKGWLECGFVGDWFNPYVTMYIWDVLLCYGWDYDSGLFTIGQDNRRTAAVVGAMLPNICCILLRMLRSSLLATHFNMVDALRDAGRKLRTKDVAEAFAKYLFNESVTQKIEIRNESGLERHIQQLHQLKNVQIEHELRHTTSENIVLDAINAACNNIVNTVLKEEEIKEEELQLQKIIKDKLRVMLNILDQRDDATAFCQSIVTEVVVEAANIGEIMGEFHEENKGWFGTDQASSPNNRQTGAYFKEAVRTKNAIATLRKLRAGHYNMTRDKLLKHKRSIKFH